MATAESMCSECGKTVWINWPDVQTAPMRTICDECQEVIDAEEATNHATA